MIKNIRIKQADKVKCSREWSWNSEDNGWSGYHFWYVKSGVGHIEVEDESYDIYGGDSFCFDLTRNHRCTHLLDNPLSVYTVYFQADLAQGDKLRRIVRNDSALGQAMEKCIDACEISDYNLAVMWLQPVIGEFLRREADPPPRNGKIRNLRGYMEDHLEEDMDLAQMAGKAGYSKNQLIRLFKKDYGMTPVQYFTFLRIEQAKKMMRYSSMSVTEIAYSVGYMDISYFSKVFKSYVGCAPREYRTQAEIE